MAGLTKGRRLAAALVAGAILAGCGAGAATDDTVAGSPVAGDAVHFGVERIVTGLDRPTFVGAAPGDVAALWVLEQPGRVIRIEGDQRSLALDITGEVRTDAEAGLLGMAFHPGFATNRRLFLHWTDKGGDTRVAEFVAEADGKAIQRRPVRELLFVDQPEENHNGGQLAFGPDARMYLGLGDGGGAFDPRRTAQNPRRYLGKVLAVDVDAPAPSWEIILSGLRNPWRFSFDPAMGEIWVADVGQDKFEEVNRVRLEFDEPPKNLGWSTYEGTKKIRDRKLDRRGELVHPVVTYTHEDGCAVIGGFVYSGIAFPELVRRYVFGDFCSGTLWSVRGTPIGGATDLRREKAKVPQLAHIGQDGDGELVFASAAGFIYRAVPPAG